jgi:urease accessory protein
MGTSPQLVAMMLADGRLPTGGHTQSAGLEPAVRTGLGDEGRRLEDVADYARDRLRTVTRVEAGTAVVARGSALSGASLRPVELAWAARTPSQALRAASRRQGRAYVRLAARVWPSVLDHLVPDTEVPRPVVVGVVAAVTGLSALETARLVGYEDAQTVVSAAMKLLPVDPADTSVWMQLLHPDIERLADLVAGLTRPDDLPADGAPLVDQLAQQHVIERMRLFHA